MRRKLFLHKGSGLEVALPLCSHLISWNRITGLPQTQWETGTWVSSGAATLNKSSGRSLTIMQKGTTEEVLSLCDSTETSEKQDAKFQGWEAKVF